MGRKSTGRRRAKARAGSGSAVTGGLNASISTEAELTTEGEVGRTEDEKPSATAQELILRIEAYRKSAEEQKTSVFTEDSILTVGEYSKAVGKALEAVEKCANGAGEDGVVWTSTLRRLLLCRYNPPLQLWWTFTAAEKNAQLESNADPLLQGAATMDFVRKLLVSLKALSAVNASGNLAVAALAPIVALLHDVATLLQKYVGSLKSKHNDSDSVDGKKARNVVRKLRGSIREILSFIVVCHRRDLPEYRVLTTLPSAEHSARPKVVEFFYPPFPLASKHMMRSINKNPLNSAVIAEVVSVEVVLLQVLVETIDWRSRVKKQKKEPCVRHEEFVVKIKSLTRHSIWTGSTFSMSEMLLDMLLEKRLPVGNLMDDEEEKVVRECIIETVLVDPPLFGLFEKAAKKNIDLPDVLFMKKLAIGRRAIQLARAQGNRMRADALSKRITSWETPLQLMKWLQVQKRHLLPVTALLGSQAFLNWVTSTSDEVAFTSIFDRCVSAFAAKVQTNEANGESKADAIEMEDEEEEDLFFVDTAGEAKDESTDVAADLAFTAAAKDIRKGKTSGKRGKERGPIYSRLPQGATPVDKRGRKTIEEIEDSNSDSDSDSNAEDPTLMEDDSSAEDPRLAEESSSDDEPIARFLDKRKRKKKSGKGSKEDKVDEEPVADSLTTPARIEVAQVTREQDVEMSEAVAVPSDTIVPSKDEVSGKSGKDIAKETVNSTPVSAPVIQSSEIQDGQSMGGKDQETAGVQLEPSEALSNSENLLVKKDANGSLVDSAQEAEVGAVPGPITSPTSKDVDEEMVEASSGVATSDKPPIKPESRSEQDADISGGKDPAAVGNLLPSASEVAEMEGETVRALPSSIVVSSSKTSGKSKRARKAVVEQDSEAVEASSSPAALTTENDLTIQKSPSVLVTSSETSSRSKRGKKATGSKHTETVDDISAPAVTNEKDLNVMENPSIPVTSSGTSSQSKRGKKASADTETVDSVLAEAQVSTEKDSEKQEATSLSTTSEKTSSKSKRGKKATANQETESVETVISVVSGPPAILQKDSEMQDATPTNASDETPMKKSKRGKNVAANEETEAVETAISALPVISEKDFEVQVASPLSTTSEKSSGKSKRGKKATATKEPDTVESVPAASPVQKEKDHEMQEAVQVLQSTVVDSDETPSQIEGDTKVTADKAAEVVAAAPAPAVDDSKAVENLPSTADTDQKTDGQVPIAVPTSSELTQPSADRELETWAGVPSSASPTSKKKRGRKPKLRNPEPRGDLPPVVTPTTRRIATRGTTPHVVEEKEEEKVVDDDEAPIVLVTPHKTPRKSRKKVTVQDPLEKVSEDVEAPVSDSGLPSMAKQSEISQGKYKAGTETGEVPPPTSVQATPSRGRKRAKAQVISEDEFEDSPTPSVQATPSRGRKSSNKVKVSTDDEVDPTPTPSVQPIPSRGRKSTKAKVVTDDETDDTATPSVQPTSSRGRKSTKAKVTTDDEADDVVQPTLSRGRKSTKSKVTTDDEIDETSPAVQTTASKGKKAVKDLEDGEEFENLSSSSDQGTHGKDGKSSKSEDGDGDEWMPPSASKTPRKKTRASSQPPEEDQEMRDQPGAVPVFTPRRSKRGSASSQVVGESLDMALSPYRSSKKRKTKLPVIVDLEDDE